MRRMIATVAAWGCVACNPASESTPRAKSEAAASGAAPAKAPDASKAEQQTPAPAGPVALVEGRVRTPSMIAYRDSLVLALTGASGSTIVSLGAEEPRVLAGPVDGVHALYTDGVSIFWIVSTDEVASIHRIQPEGESWSKPELVTKALPPDRTRVWELVATDEFLFTVGASGLLRIPKGGGEPQPVPVEVGLLTRIAASGGKLYGVVFVRKGGSKLLVSEDGESLGPAALLESPTLIGAFAVDGETIYWTTYAKDDDRTSILMRREGTAEPEELARSGVELSSIDVGEGFLGIDRFDDGIARYSFATKSLDEVARIRMWAPMVTVIGGSMVWFSGEGIWTTADAPLAKVRTGKAIDAKALMALAR